MEYFDDIKNVNDYIKMAEGYDGKEIIKILQKYLKPGSTVLELGMGPGIDMAILEEKYKVTGSDLSKVFIDLYLSKKPGADIIQLNAVDMNTDRKFDCIYSNKVLHSVDRNQLQSSFKNQTNVLNSDGLMCHTFWFGDKVILIKGMTFFYYTEETILKYLPSNLEVIHTEVYQELDENDSLLLILKKS